MIKLNYPIVLLDSIVDTASLLDHTPTMKNESVEMLLSFFSQGSVTNAVCGIFKFNYKNQFFSANCKKEQKWQASHPPTYTLQVWRGRHS